MKIKEKSQKNLEGVLNHFKADFTYFYPKLDVYTVIFSGSNPKWCVIFVINLDLSSIRLTMIKKLK